MVERPKNIIPDLPLDMRTTLAGGIGGAPLTQLTPTTPGYELAIRPQPAQPYSSYWSNFQPMADERRPATPIATPAQPIVSTPPTSVPAPAPEPQPAAAKAAPQPISIVRGLQNTEYLPSINERGQVQYKAKMTAADELAAAKSTAEVAKLFGEAKKAETPSASDTAINTYLGLIKGQYEPMLKSPDANVRTQAVTEYKNAVADVIAKFGSDALLARLFGTTEK